MTITALPTPPSSTDKNNFNSRADAFLAALVNFVTEANATADELSALVAALNFNSTNSISATSLAIGYGSKSLTVQSGKSYVVGMTVKIASTSDGTKWMRGDVTAYDPGTGALSVVVNVIQGAGTFTDWTISLDVTVLDVGDHSVLVRGGNGLGSTNTMIRRFSTVVENLGSDITYADSATYGASFTINRGGVFFIGYVDAATTGNQLFGISINSTQLTTAINGIADANVLLISETGTTSRTNSMSGVYTFSAGDVLRAHVSMSGFTTINKVQFMIRRIR